MTRTERLVRTVFLASGFLALSMPAYAQIAVNAGSENETNGWLHRFLENNLTVAFAAVAFIGFVAGAVLTHLRK